MNSIARRNSRPNASVFRRGPWAAAVLAVLSVAAALTASAADLGSLERRAKAGDVAALMELGRRAEHGIGQRANPRAAVRWYRQAAGQGQAAAQYAMGRLCSGGEGVTQDQAEAVRWFYRAAAQGYVLAQNRLGRAYELGQGVRQDLTEACSWYILAAETHPAARINQHHLTRRLTETQLAEAQLRASSLLSSTVARRTR